MTFDPSREGNKYELTEYVCRKQDNINLLLDINFGNNPIIVRAAIQALIDAEKDGLYIDRAVIRDLSQYINTLGGIYLIDALSYDTVYNKATGLIARSSIKRKAEKKK